MEKKDGYFVVGHGQIIPEELWSDENMSDGTHTWKVPKDRCRIWMSDTSGNIIGLFEYRRDASRTGMWVRIDEESKVQHDPGTCSICSLLGGLTEKLNAMQKCLPEGGKLTLMMRIPEVEKLAILTNDRIQEVIDMAQDVVREHPQPEEEGGNLDEPRKVTVH